MARMAHLPGSIDIAHEVDGGEDRGAVLLIHGLGSQLVDWDPAMVHRFVAAGYRVVRMDNRDAGESTHLHGKVALGELRRSVERGVAVDVPYRLGDMADDAVGVLDHLGVDAAHVIGVSMGGYIAQEMAISHPSRVRSLTSIMSSTGAKDVGQPSAEGNRALFRAPAADPAEAVADMLEARRILATPGAFDEASERVRIRRAVLRSFDPAGTGRQLAAIWAGGDRSMALGRLEVPALVIHGDQDHLVDMSGGVATAATIPLSRLEIIEGMGHDLPPLFWGQIVGTIVEHLDAAECLPLPDTRIVPANPNDAATYAELCRRAFAPDAERYGSGPPGLDDPEVQRDILTRGHCHGVEMGGRLVGGLYMFPHDDGRWYLGTIFIDPDLHGRGLGSLLMAFARMGHPAVRGITLETPYRNPHLHTFYESHGYRKVGETTPGDHPEATDPDFRLFTYQQDFAV